MSQSCTLCGTQTDMLATVLSYAALGSFGTCESGYKIVENIGYAYEPILVRCAACCCAACCSLYLPS